jgi:hypothetical protein
MRFGVIVGVLLLAGCHDDSMTRNFGLARDAAPDTVAATQVPLSTPPSLALRPTRPGAIAPHQTSPSEPTTGSAGQDALLQAAGPGAPADIRQLINENSGMIDRGPAFTDQLMSWTPPPGSTPMSQPVQKGWLSRIF